MKKRTCTRLAALAGLAAGIALSSGAHAQYVIVNDVQGTFVDISGTGTALSFANLDDGTAAFTSTVTNALVSNPNLYACTNGTISDTDTFTAYGNTALPALGPTLALFPFWDDLYLNPPGAVYVQSIVQGGINVQIIQWNQVMSYPCCTNPVGTFEVKIFDSGPTLVQFLYADVAFAGSSNGNGNGASATIGAQWSGGFSQYSSNFASIQSGSVLSFVADGTGGCCLPSGQCSVITHGSCSSQGGIYRGDDSTCAGANCPPGGACCRQDGSCTLGSSAACSTAGGVYHGDGSSCASACPCSGVVNGGFESGGFSPGWTQFGNTAFTAVNAGVWVVVSPHGGTYESHFGPVGSTGGVTQMVTANAGDMVTVNFWYACNTTTPNSFSADLGSTHLIDFTDDLNHQDWTFFTFTIPAPTANPVLTFTARHDPQYVYLDDIQVCLQPQGSACYANCDLSTTQPCLNVLDFQCFLNQFAAGATYANCDNSTTIPVLNVLDFQCFLNKFAAGCSSC